MKVERQSIMRHISTDNCRKQRGTYNIRYTNILSWVLVKKDKKKKERSIHVGLIECRVMGKQITEPYGESIWGEMAGFLLKVD